MDFKSLYMNMTAEHTIEFVKELVFETRDIILKADIIIGLSMVSIFNIFFGSTMGTQVVPHSC